MISVYATSVCHPTGRMKHRIDINIYSMKHPIHRITEGTHIPDMMLAI